MTGPNGLVAEFPSTREEAWRYTPVDEIVARLEAATADATEAADAAAAVVSHSLVDALASDTRGTRIVFVNGAYEARLSNNDALPDGVWCGLTDPHHGIDDTGLELRQNTTVDGFLARNLASGTRGIVVVVDDDVEVVGPVHIIHISVPMSTDNVATPDPRHSTPADHRGDGHEGHVTVASHPRSIIDVGDNSHIALIETFCGLHGAAVTNTASTIRVGRGAKVEHCRVQTESIATTHIGHTRIEQEAGSRFQMISVTIGSDIARNAVLVHLNGPGATTTLAGVNVTTGRQRHDTVVTVDHGAPGCTSTQRFTGVVDDHGRCSFSGEILVRPGMDATDAQQFNRNLILGPNAEADTRPWLQILADDVRCNHGATVGRLDDDALFYLRSRGIPLEMARSMLVDAFIRDITDAIPEESLRQHILALIGTTTDGEAPL
jgi:Fe-S cluster assembly protein SufD